MLTCGIAYAIGGEFGGITPRSRVAQGACLGGAGVALGSVCTWRSASISD